MQGMSGNLLILNRWRDVTRGWQPVKPPGCFLSRVCQSEAYSFPGPVSRKLFLDSRNDLVEPIPFQKHSPGSSSWIPGIPLWSLFLSRTSLQEAYIFPGALSRKLSLDSRYTLVEPVPFQEHSPGSPLRGTLSRKLILDSRNTIVVCFFPEHSPEVFSQVATAPFFKNIYQMVKNRAANMKAKTYFWPGRQNLCYYSANFQIYDSSCFVGCYY